MRTEPHSPSSEPSSASPSTTSRAPSVSAPSACAPSPLSSSPPSVCLVSPSPRRSSRARAPSMRAPASPSSSSPVSLSLSSYPRSPPSAPAPLRRRGRETLEVRSDLAGIRAALKSLSLACQRWKLQIEQGEGRLNAEQRTWGSSFFHHENERRAAAAREGARLSAATDDEVDSGEREEGERHRVDVWSDARRTLARTKHEGGDALRHSAWRQRRDPRDARKAAESCLSVLAGVQPLSASADRSFKLPMAPSAWVTMPPMRSSKERPRSPLLQTAAEISHFLLLLETRVVALCVRRPPAFLRSDRNGAVRPPRPRVEEETAAARDEGAGGDTHLRVDQRGESRDSEQDGEDARERNKRGRTQELLGILQLLVDTPVLPEGSIASIFCRVPQGENAACLLSAASSASELSLARKETCNQHSPFPADCKPSFTSSVCALSLAESRCCDASPRVQPQSAPRSPSLHFVTHCLVALASRVIRSLCLASTEIASRGVSSRRPEESACPRRARSDASEWAPTVALSPSPRLSASTSAAMPPSFRSFSAATQLISCGASPRGLVPSPPSSLALQAASTPRARLPSLDVPSLRRASSPMESLFDLLLNPRTPIACLLPLVQAVRIDTRDSFLFASLLRRALAGVCLVLPPSPLPLLPPARRSGCRLRLLARRASSAASSRTASPRRHTSRSRPFASLRGSSPGIAVFPSSPGLSASLHVTLAAPLEPEERFFSWQCNRCILLPHLLRRFDVGSWCTHLLRAAPVNRDAAPKKQKKCGNRNLNLTPSADPEANSGAPKHASREANSAEKSATKGRHLPDAGDDGGQKRGRRSRGEERETCGDAETSEDRQPCSIESHMLLRGTRSRGDRSCDLNDETPLPEEESQAPELHSQELREAKRELLVTTALNLLNTTLRLAVLRDEKTQAHRRRGQADTRGLAFAEGKSTAVRCQKESEEKIKLRERPVINGCLVAAGSSFAASPPPASRLFPSSHTRFRPLAARPVSSLFPSSSSSLPFAHPPSLESDAVGLVDETYAVCLDLFLSLFATPLSASSSRSRNLPCLGSFSPPLSRSPPPRGCELRASSRLLVALLPMLLSEALPRSLFHVAFPKPLLHLLLAYLECRQPHDGIATHASGTGQTSICASPNGSRRRSSPRQERQTRLSGSAASGKICGASVGLAVLAYRSSVRERPLHRRRLPLPVCSVPSAPGSASASPQLLLGFLSPASALFILAALTRRRALSAVGLLAAASGTQPEGRGGKRVSGKNEETLRRRDERRRRAGASDGTSAEERGDEGRRQLRQDLFRGLLALALERLFGSDRATVLGGQGRGAPLETVEARKRIVDARRRQPERTAVLAYSSGRVAEAAPAPFHRSRAFVTSRYQEQRKPATLRQRAVALLATLLVSLVATDPFREASSEPEGAEAEADAAAPSPAGRQRWASDQVGAEFRTTQTRYGELTFLETVVEIVVSHALVHLSKVECTYTLALGLRRLLRRACGLRIPSFSRSFSSLSLSPSLAFSPSLASHDSLSASTARPSASALVRCERLLSLFSRWKQATRRHGMQVSRSESTAAATRLCACSQRDDSPPLSIDCASHGARVAQRELHAAIAAAEARNAVVRESGVLLLHALAQVHSVSASTSQRAFGAPSFPHIHTFLLHSVSSIFAGSCAPCEPCEEETRSWGISYLQPVASASPRPRSVSCLVALYASSREPPACGGCAARSLSTSTLASSQAAPSRAARSSRGAGGPLPPSPPHSRSSGSLSPILQRAASQEPPLPLTHEAFARPQAPAFAVPAARRFPSERGAAPPAAARALTSNRSAAACTRGDVAGKGKQHFKRPSASEALLEPRVEDTRREGDTDGGGRRRRRGCLAFAPGGRSSSSLFELSPSASSHSSEASAAEQPDADAPDAEDPRPNAAAMRRQCGSPRSDADLRGAQARPRGTNRGRRAPSAETGDARDSLCVARAERGEPREDAEDKRDKEATTEASVVAGAEAQTPARKRRASRRAGSWTRRRGGGGRAAGSLCRLAAGSLCRLAARRQKARARIKGYLSDGGCAEDGLRGDAADALSRDRHSSALRRAARSPHTRRDARLSRERRGPQVVEGRGGSQAAQPFACGRHRRARPDPAFAAALESRLRPEAPRRHPHASRAGRGRLASLGRGR
ncbi:hypothetical protein BESB_052300 [Besnoitia besnoiti]|uniref:Uncharacterized protein n=1 Tax=Besnoitia besnoiti TaxID=94643 RepID=A0A2A9MCH5_BESBE|nr:hypothetical protein BESB_052300 [Besnoitia besnoiti]PFH35579.1 hypothetical protein BESB_052300 [Besnoitia besnoiti]